MSSHAHWFHEIGCTKLGVAVSLKNSSVLNWRSYAESYEMTVVQLLLLVSLCMTSGLNNFH